VKQYYAKHDDSSFIHSSPVTATSRVLQHVGFYWSGVTQISQCSVIILGVKIMFWISPQLNILH